MSKVAAAMLCTACCASQAADAPAPIYTQRLSTPEIAELAALACQARHGLPHNSITAWSSKRGDRKNLQATVSCQPHATTQNYALYHQASCSRSDEWQCGRSEVRLRTTLATHQVEIATNGYKPELAYSLISKIAAYRLPKGDPVLEGDSVQCALRKGPSKELLDISCNDKLIRLSYWCPQSSCPRVFWINGYFVPADAGGL